MQVEHQAMTVIAHWRERKHLGIDRRLEFDHDAHHARTVLPGADQADIGVGLHDLGGQGLQHAVQLHALEVDHQAIRVLHQHVAVAQLGRSFEGDAGVFGRGPDAHREQARRRCMAHRAQHQGQGGAGKLEQAATVDAAGDERS